MVWTWSKKYERAKTGPLRGFVVDLGKTVHSAVAKMVVVVVVVVTAPQGKDPRRSGRVGLGSGHAQVRSTRFSTSPAAYQQRACRTVTAPSAKYNQFSACRYQKINHGRPTYGM
jgi:hypothetical protein